MQSDFIPYLQSLEHQHSEMANLLAEWVNINSGSDNLEGLNKMFSALEKRFSQFGCKIESITLPPRLQIDLHGNLIEQPVGKAFRIIQRPALKRRIFLGGHMDTVFPKYSGFQVAERISKDRLKGPGAVDMKSGLLIMLKALETFENSPWASEIGWNLIINPDEEIGSVSSEAAIIETARGCEVGLIFEPSFADGHLVSARKGSANYSVVVKGRAAHAGRDFHQGRNAIAALARFVAATDNINNLDGNTTLNFGYIQGGGPVNIVPELALGRLNVRCELPEEQVSADKLLNEAIEKANDAEGIHVELFRESFRAPKPFTDETKRLFEKLRLCGEQLSMDLAWRPSGGVCDGNILAEVGIPCIDTLGAVGGSMHTHEEYVDLDSLPKRAMLTALLLMSLAADK